MSLTYHLKHKDFKDSPVRRFLREAFRETRPPLADCREAMRESPLILGEGVSGGAYSQIGTAIDYRIRYHFAITPPSQFAASFEADTLLGSDCAAEFFEALNRTVHEIAPHRRRLTDDEEQTLARYCLILAALEAPYRAGARAWPPGCFGDVPPSNAADMLAAVPEDWAKDAAALAAAFAERYPSWHGADAVLNPTFAGSLDVGGADADFIADGCLWEIKTTKDRVRGTDLHQLLGYSLLDYDDEYAIDRVGVLLPRHNTRVSWPIGELIAVMSGSDDLELADLRERFRAVCEVGGRSRSGGAGNFIGLAGEGEQPYTRLVASSGERLEDERGLSTHDVLMFLKRLRGERVIYRGARDFMRWLDDLHYEEKVRLIETGEAWHRTHRNAGWYIRYAPGRLLTARLLRDPPTEGSVVAADLEVHDVGGYFNGTLAQALADWRLHNAVDSPEATARAVSDLMDRWWRAK